MKSPMNPSIQPPLTKPYTPIGEGVSTDLINLSFTEIQSIFYIIQSIKSANLNKYLVSSDNLIVIHIDLMLTKQTGNLTKKCHILSILDKLCAVMDLHSNNLGQRVPV